MSKAWIVDDELWAAVAVPGQLHQILLGRLNAATRIDWSRAAIDVSHIDA